MNPADRACLHCNPGCCVRAGLQDRITTGIDVHPRDPRALVLPADAPG
jgi:hypothetical protein